MIEIISCKGTVTSCLEKEILSNFNGYTFKKVIDAFVRKDISSKDYSRLSRLVNYRRSAQSFMYSIVIEKMTERHEVASLMLDVMHKHRMHLIDEEVYEFVLRRLNEKDKVLQMLESLKDFNNN